jgi:WD40 repeat protein
VTTQAPLTARYTLCGAACDKLFFSSGVSMVLIVVLGASLRAQSLSVPVADKSPISSQSIFGLSIPPQSDSYLLTDPPETLRPRLSRVSKIFIDRCLGCHNSEEKQGGYAMDTPAQLFAPGDTKRSPIRLPTQRSEEVGTDLLGQYLFPEGLGELFERLVSEDPKLRMPLDADPLTWEEIEDIRQWIVMGSRIDGTSDAPLESFLPITISTEPKLVDYPKPHPIQALGFDVQRRWVFTSGYYEVLVFSMPSPQPRQEIELDGKSKNKEEEESSSESSSESRSEGESDGISFDDRPIARIPTRGRHISDLQFDPASGTLWVASGEPGKLGFVESIPVQETESGLGTPGVGLSVGARRLVWVCRDTPLDIALSPSAERLAIGQSDGSIVMMHAISGSLLWRATAHAAAVTSVDWSRDSKTLLTASRDRMGKSFLGSDGTMLSSFIDSERTVASLVALNRGAVGFDEAGVVRYYPNFTTPNARTSRDGFPQQTQRMVTHNDDFFVLQSDRIRHFRVRREEVVESKGEDGKEKKKTNFHLDEREGVAFFDANKPLSLQANFLPIRIERSVMGLSGTGPDAPYWIAVGGANGQVLFWNPETGKTTTLLCHPRN